MKRLDLYIGRAVLAATLLAWLVVITLDGLFMFIGQLGDIGRGDYSTLDAAAFVLLSLPARACQAFPMSALIGTVLALGNLAAQSELDAFRLAGCSVARLSAAVLRVGVLMVCGVLLIGEGFAPRGQQLAGQLRSEAIFADLSVQRDAGFWVRDGSRFVQVGQSEVDGSLSAVTIFEVGDGSALKSVTAVDRATPADGTWVLQNVRSSAFHPQRIDVEQAVSVHWPVLIDRRLAELLTRQPGTLSLRELGEYIDYLERNGSDVARYLLNYWQRWAAPVMTLAMLLLAVALVLGPLHKRPLGQRLLVAVFAGLVFKLLAEVIAHAGMVYGLPLLLSAFLPALLVLLPAAVLLRRA